MTVPLNVVCNDTRSNGRKVSQERGDEIRRGGDNHLHTCSETDGWPSMILFDLLKKRRYISIPNYSIIALCANKKIKDCSTSVKNIRKLKVLDDIITVSNRFTFSYSGTSFGK